MSWWLVVKVSLSLSSQKNDRVSQVSFLLEGNFSWESQIALDTWIIYETLELKCWLDWNFELFILTKPRYRLSWDKERLVKLTFWTSKVFFIWRPIIWWSLVVKMSFLYFPKICKTSFEQIFRKLSSPLLEIMWITEIKPLKKNSIVISYWCCYCWNISNCFCCKLFLFIAAYCVLQFSFE